MNFKGIDFVSFVLPLFLVALSLLFVLATIVINNLEAKDVVFSFTALIAAFVLFALNTMLSLKNEESTTRVNSQLSFNPVNQCVDLRVFQGEHKSEFILKHATSLASNFELVKKLNDLRNSDGKNYQSQKNLAEEAILNVYKFAIVAHLIESYRDWDLNHVQFRGSDKIIQRINGNGQNDTELSMRELSHEMGNIVDFSSHVVPQRATWLLPADTKFRSDKNGLLLDNPFVKLRISIESDLDTWATGLYKTNRYLKQACIDSQENQEIVNYNNNIVINVNFKKQRNGSTQKQKYKDWVEKLLSSINQGFSSYPD